MSNDSILPPAPPHANVTSPAGASVPPYGAPTQPVAPKQNNLVGLIGLIVAAVGFVCAVIPGLLGIGWLLLPIGFILGIVGVCLRGRKKGLSIAAIIVAVVGTIAGFIAFTTYALTAVGDALDEASGGDTAVVADEVEGEQGAEAEEVAADSAASAEGTREHPLPIGSTITNDDWEVTVNSVTLGATDAVLAANTFNSAPEEGYEYALINVTAKNLSDEPSMAAMVQVEYVTADGVTIDGLGDVAVAPDALDSLTELYKDATVTGNIAIAVPSATAAQGTIAVTPGMFAEPVFFAAQ